MTTTYLRVGRGRWPSKPPKGNPSPCVDEAVYGANILRDPGFELHAGNGFDNYGVDGEDFAAGLRTDTSPLGQLYWDAERPTTPLAVIDSYYDDAGWSIWETYDPATYPLFAAQTPVLSTANPRSGTYHIRWSVPDEFDNEIEIEPLGGQTCENDRAYSAVVAAGDTITWSGYVNVAVSAGVAWTGYVAVGYFASDQTHLAPATSEYSETGVTLGSYTLISVSATVPADAKYAVCGFGAYTSGITGATTVDFDDCTLALPAA